MRILYGLLLFFMLAAPGASSAAELPLTRGFYVDASTTCGNASNATLYLLQRGQLVAGGREVCVFAQIVMKDARHFVITEACDGEATSVEWTVEGEGRFSRRFAGGESYTAQYCAQPSLPAPWRDNDISDHIR